MIKISHLLSVTALTLSSAAVNAATVWAPTNEDIDYLQFEVPGYTTDGGVLAMFDEDGFGSDAALLIGANGGQVTFSQSESGPNWIATFSDGGFIELSGDNKFTLGMTWDRGDTWYADSSYAANSGGSPDTYRIGFDGQMAQGPGEPSVEVKGWTVAVDLRPDVPQVPVPAAAWLFGTGLIGLVGVARRRV